MKAIIYAGISLFSVATIYGVADYYNSKQKGTLNNLYKEEPSINNETKPVVKDKDLKTISTKTTSYIPKVKAPKNYKISKRTIKLENFSRGRIEETVPVEISKPDEIIKSDQDRKDDKSIIKDLSTVNESVIPSKEPARKLNLEMFSRAPLKKYTKKDNKQ